MKSNCTYNVLIQIFWIGTYWDFFFSLVEPFMADYILQCKVTSSQAEVKTLSYPVNVKHLTSNMLLASPKVHSKEFDNQILTSWNKC